MIVLDNSEGVRPTPSTSCFFNSLLGFKCRSFSASILDFGRTDRGLTQLRNFDSPLHSG